MQRYGVKLKSGRILWVLADDVEVCEGVVLFLARTAGAKETLAGFPLAVIDHFGRPEAFPSAEAAATQA